MNACNESPWKVELHFICVVLKEMRAETILKKHSSSKLNLCHCLSLCSLQANLQLSGKLGRPGQLVLWALWFSYISVEYNLCVCVSLLNCWHVVTQLWFKLIDCAYRHTIVLLRSRWSFDWQLSAGIFELITAAEKELGKHTKRKIDSSDVGVRGTDSTWAWA